MQRLPLLMIPGPIEVSPGVVQALAGAPKSHVSAEVIDAFGCSLRKMRGVWLSGAASQPFVVSGGGTLAMEMAVWNLVDPGEQVAVINTGYFSDRMAEMLRRRGAVVREVAAEPGRVPCVEDVERLLQDQQPKVLFATHVDTSTGVRVDPRPVCALAADLGVLTVFDGVCATAAEEFRQESWGADVYLTASQKALGLPAGLALMVVSERGLETRRALRHVPPMMMDWEQWLPVMQAYELGRGAYFSTPATTLMQPLKVALQELVPSDREAGRAMNEHFARHRKTGEVLRAAWREMGLELLVEKEADAANTLSAIRYPKGIGPSLISAIRDQGVVVAGGLYPSLKSTYFRVGHMGWVTRHPHLLAQTACAIGTALNDQGYAVDVESIRQVVETQWTGVGLNPVQQ